MNMMNFDRSYLSWTSTRINHSPRCRLDAFCIVTCGGSTMEYYLTAPCAGENMYLPSGLVQQPAYEFTMIYAGDGQFMTVKRYGNPALAKVEVHAVGEITGTNDGRGAPIREMKVTVTRVESESELNSHDEVCEAIAADAAIAARTEFTASDGSIAWAMEYPVRVCNISHAALRWQVDAGPVLVPPCGATTDILAALRIGFAVYNEWDWAEFVRRAFAPDEAAPGGGEYAIPVRLNVRNRLFRIAP